MNIHIIMFVDGHLSLQAISEEAAGTFKLASNHIILLIEPVFL